MTTAGGGTMFATVRETHYASDERRPGPAQMDQFRALRERQPGYAGMVAVDAGNGRTLALVAEPAPVLAGHEANYSQAPRG